MSQADADKASKDFAAINAILQYAEVDGNHLIWTRKRADGRLVISASLSDHHCISIRRWLYEQVFEEKIPVFHRCVAVCGNDQCIRPIHLQLEPLKQKKCFKGHWMSKKNTYTYTSKDGKIHRHCRTCRKRRKRVENKKRRRAKNE